MIGITRSQGISLWVEIQGGLFIFTRSRDLSPSQAKFFFFPVTWSIHFRSLSFQIPATLCLEKSANGPTWAFTYVFLNNSSSSSIVTVLASNSCHVLVFGPNPYATRLFSNRESWEMKELLTSKSGRLEFRNSRVLRRDHLYLLIIYAAMITEAQDCPRTELTRTDSVLSKACSMKSKVWFAISLLGSKIS